MFRNKAIPYARANKMLLTRLVDIQPQPLKPKGVKKNQPNQKKFEVVGLAKTVLQENQ